MSGWKCRHPWRGKKKPGLDRAGWNVSPAWGTGLGEGLETSQGVLTTLTVPFRESSGIFQIHRKYSEVQPLWPSSCRLSAGPRVNGRAVLTACGIMMGQEKAGVNGFCGEMRNGSHEKRDPFHQDERMGARYTESCCWPFCPDSVCLIPVGTGSHIHYQRNFELCSG